MHLTEIVLHSTSIIVVVITAILALQLIRLSGKTSTWIYLSVGILLLAIASFEQYLEHSGISAGLFTNHIFIDALRLGTSVLMLAAVISGVSIFRERKMGLELLDKQIQRLQHAPPESEIGMTDSERATRQALIRSGRHGVSVVTALQYLRDEEQRIVQTLKDWQATFDAITIPVFVYDRSYHLIRANRAYLERAGAAMKDIMGKPYFDVFPKLGRPIIDPPQNAGRDIADSEVRLPTGEVFISRNYPIYSENNEYRHTLHTLQEVTLVKQAEKSIRRVRLSLKVVANCIREMLKEKDEPQMLHTVCKVAVNSGLFRAVWIGRAEQDDKKTLRPLAFQGHSLDLSQLPDSTWDDSGDSRSPTGVAISTGKTCVVQDLMHDSKFSTFRRFAAKNHLASAVSLPLSQDEMVWGGMTFYSDEPSAFSDEEIDALEILSASVALSITELHSGPDHKTGLLPTTQSLGQSRANLEKIIVALETAIEARSDYGAPNQRLVGEIGMAIAMEMGLTHAQAYGVRLAGIVHDVGEIHVPQDILRKIGELTPDEYAQVKHHPQAGYDILSKLDLPWPLAQTVLQHHERMNGSGYPNGLSGDQILLEARIIAVADTIVAIAYQSQNHPHLGIPAALVEVNKGKGTLFDPAVVEAAVRLFQEKGYQPTPESHSQVPAPMTLQPEDQ